MIKISEDEEKIFDFSSLLEKKEQEEKPKKIEKARERIIYDTKSVPMPISTRGILTKEEIEKIIDNKLAKIKRKVEIDPKKIYDKLRLLDPTIKENEYYRVIIERAKSGRKSGYLEPYVSFINRNFDDLIKDDL